MLGSFASSLIIVSLDAILDSREGPLFLLIDKFIDRLTVSSGSSWQSWFSDLFSDQTKKNKFELLGQGARRKEKKWHKSKLNSTQAGCLRGRRLGRGESSPCRKLLSAPEGMLSFQKWMNFQKISELGGRGGSFFSFFFLNWNTFSQKRSGLP